MKNIKSKKISFPKASGDFWFLFWIGKAVKVEDSFYVPLYFVNTTHEIDYTRYLNNKERYITKVPLRNIRGYKIGTIFNNLGKIVVEPSGFDRKVLECDVLPFFKPTIRDSGLSAESSFYPLPNKTELTGFSYFKFRRYGVHVILPVITFCQYLYFRSTKIADILVNYRLRDIIDFNSIKIYEKDGVRIGQLEYDNVQLDRDQINLLAPHFFMEEAGGIKSLDLIGANLLSSFIDNKQQGKRIEASLMTVFPFSKKSSIKLKGKSFNQGDEKYFIAYEIENLNFLDNKIIVDKIVLIKRANKESSPESKNLKKEEVEQTVAYRNNLNLEISNHDDRGNSLHDVSNEKIEVNNIFGFNVLIEHQKRKDQNEAYKVTTKAVHQEVDSITTYLENTENESRSLRANVQEVLLIINREEYLKKCSILLKNKYDVQFNYLSLSNSLFVDYTYVYVGGKSYKVILIELNSCSKYYYLIEFSHGFTGFVYNKWFSKVGLPVLNMLARDYIKKGMHWNHLRSMDSYELKRQKVYFRNNDIIVGESIKHQRKDFTSIDLVVTHAADKIWRKLKIAG